MLPGADLALDNGPTGWAVSWAGTLVAGGKCPLFMVSMGTRPYIGRAATDPLSIGWNILDS